MGSKTIRLAPFGHPPAGIGGEENEVLNPGREQFLPKSTMGYYDNVADPWTLVWLDEIDIGLINRNNDWQSGPPDNGPAVDNALPKAGFWTKAGGPNSNDNNNHGGFEIYTSSDKPICLFNMGHENLASQGGSGETNVIGYDGYFEVDKQGVGGSTECAIGMMHGYCMYYTDFGFEQIKAILEFLEGLEEDGGAYNRSVPLDDHLKHLPEVFGLGVRPMGEITAIIKIIRKIVQMLQDDGVVGGKLVSWDFIAEMTEKTSANTYITPVEDSSQFNWGQKKNHPFPKRRWSRTVNLISQGVIFALKLRANGVLWHVSSPSGGLRNRIIRTTNFAFIHALSPTDTINSRKNSKYKHVIKLRENSNTPNVLNDKSIKIWTK